MKMQMYTIATFRSDTEANKARELLDENNIVSSLIIRRLKRGEFIRLQVNEENVRRATSILHGKPELRFTLRAKPLPAQNIPVKSHYLNMFLIGAGFAWLIGLLANIERNDYRTALIFVVLLVMGSLFSSIKSFYLAGVSGLVVVFGLRGLALRPPPVEYYRLVVLLIVTAAVVCCSSFYLGRVKDVNFPDTDQGIDGLLGFSGLLIGGLFGRLITYVVH